MLDLEALADEVVTGAQRYIDLALAPFLARNAVLEARLATLEAREMPVGLASVMRNDADRLIVVRSNGATDDLGSIRGKDGASVTREDVALMVDEAVAKAVAALPVPRDGEPGTPGEDGKSVDASEIAAILKAEIEPDVLGDVMKRVDDFLAAVPPPENGKDGASVTVEDVVPLIERAVAAIPPAKDGANGTNGKNGADGVGLAGTIVDRAGHLIVTLTNGTPHDLGPIIGADGKDGTDGNHGLDGLSVEDMTFEYDGERTLSLRFARGDVTRDFSVTLPIPLYRGVWKEGAYEKGDMVTWAGSQFIARENTDGKPEASPDWVLSTKRGRDGKDGTNGKDGKAGTDGRPGRDGYR